MEKLFSTEEVAKATNRTMNGIQRLARVYPHLGMRVDGSWIFKQADIDFINGINKKGGRPYKNPKPSAE